MKILLIRALTLSLVTLASWINIPLSYAYTPPDTFNSLVAGVGEGFKDGDYDQALFSDPTGITFNADGTRLYVADRGNNRVRMVDLNDNNRVKTIAGTGQSGSLEGPALTATFNKPSLLVYLPGERLIVFDEGSGIFRQIDLKTGQVTNLSSFHDRITSMAYRTEDNCLYFADPDGGQVCRLNLKSGTVSTAFKNNPLVPHPRLLCSIKGFLMVADSLLTTIYSTSLDSAALSYVGKTDKPIQALTEYDSSLCALTNGQLFVISPSPRAINIATPWGFLAQDQYTSVKPLIPSDSSRIYGLAASPAQFRKLFICGGSPSIISIKDYDFPYHWQGPEPTDFTYPVAKPPNTFRILVSGDSRTVINPRVVLEGQPTNLVIDTYAKQLEILLNLEAAENDSDIHYEVMILSRLGENPFLFGNYLIPDFVKKYDIDLVMINSTLEFGNFYTKPLTTEGIPAEQFNPEYLLKPITERLPSSGPSRRFYELCQKNKLSIGQPFITYYQIPELREALSEIYELPMLRLNEKIKKIKLKNGSSPHMVMTFLPSKYNPIDTGSAELFYKILCDKTGIPMVDITDGFNVFQTAFWPVQQQMDVHYTAYGCQLVAYLLSQELISQKFIPFSMIKDKN